MAFIRERKRKDGSPHFSVTYRLGGRGSRQSSTSFPDEKQAKRFCTLVDSYGAERALELAGIADTQRPMSTQTVTEYLDGHIAGLSGVHQKTVSEYQRYVRNDIGPALGAIPLSKLTRADVALWVNAMQKDGAAGGTIQNKHGFLSGALKRAVKTDTWPLIHARTCGCRVPRKRKMSF